MVGFLFIAISSFNGHEKPFKKQKQKHGAMVKLDLGERTPDMYYSRDVLIMNCVRKDFYSELQQQKISLGNSVQWDFECRRRRDIMDRLSCERGVFGMPRYWSRKAFPQHKNIQLKMFPDWCIVLPSVWVDSTLFKHGTVFHCHTPN